MNAFSQNGGAEDNQMPPLDPSFEPADFQATDHQAPTPVATHEASSDAGNIAKIRDILFGPQMRDYEQRFAHLEEALKKESMDLRETTRRQLEALETFIHKEVAALEGRLIIERDERSASDVRLATDLSVTSTSILKKIGEIENQEAQAKREIRSDLHQQSKELTDAIHAKGEELVALLERRAQDLQHTKADRAALAALFSELSVRLADQFKVASGD